MKFSYSLIKKLLPSAPAKPRLVDGLNMHSFETEDAKGDVMEIGLPPNRYSDAASHIGIAREAAAVFGLKFRNPVKTIINPPSNKGLIKIEVKDQRLCPRYAARYFEIDPSTSSGQGKIGESLRWMQDVLLSCGLKPKNNIVDIMNYVMLETGQPLHAFDADKLATSDKKHGTKKIIVRKARRGEKIETLDDQKLTLDSDVLVIADMDRPAAIAGIKGGKSSGVSAHTKRIIVEAANFDPVLIYRTAKKLKLQTDASTRFGHGMSPWLVQQGLDRATELILKQKTWLLDSVDYYPKRASEEIIEFDAAKYESLIGAPMDIRKAAKYFELLGFEIIADKRGKSQRKSAPNQRQSAFLVRVPSWRTDISNIEDLVEEVSRLAGYNKLRPRPPVVSVKPSHQDDFITLKDRVCAMLKNLQLDEVYNSSFVGDADLRRTDADKGGSFPRQSALSPRLRPASGGQAREPALVTVENPIAEDKKYLRPSLLPLLIKNVEDNARFFELVRIFEIGKVFPGTKDIPKEKLSLGIALAEKGNNRLILELKGIVDELLKSLGVDDFSFVSQGNTLRIETDHKVLGEIVHANMEKKWVAACAELDLEAVLNFTEDAKEFVPLKRFPAVLRDISVLVGADVRIGDVVQEIQYANQKLIENVDLIDEYTPTQIYAERTQTYADNFPRSSASSQRESANKRSLTFRIIFQADDRTITDEEVNREMEKISEMLKRKFKAEVR